MNSLAIVGAGGHGIVIADIAASLNWNQIFFFDEIEKDRLLADRWKIIGPLSELVTLEKHQTKVVVAVGDNTQRKRCMNQVEDFGFSFATLVHRSAAVSPMSEVGRGCVLTANSVVNPLATIGDGSIINTSATIDHDCRIGRFCHISPGVNLGGNVSVGDETWIGIGASVLHGAQIGSKTIIGAGSVVTTDIPSNVVAYGAPAKVIRSRNR